MHTPARHACRAPNPLGCELSSEFGKHAYQSSASMHKEARALERLYPAHTRSVRADPRTSAGSIPLNFFRL
eukprot:6078553-Pleurochrysis_carterae.AAC.1